MPRLPATALACLALTAGGAAIAGCGSDDETDSASAPATTTAPDTGGAPAGTASGAALKVSMKDIKYIPADVTVKVDQKIVWTNDDGNIPHTVTAEDGADFDSGNITGGKTYEYTPTKAGKIAYVCTIHPSQKGTITVE